MKKSLFKVAASVSVSLSMMSGVAVAAPVINNTGPGSLNKIKVTNVQSCVLKNKSNIGVQNFTGQNSHTGKAKVTNNTTGGSAASGVAVNTNTTSAGVALTSTADPLDCDTTLATDGSGSRVANTGPRSVNVIENKNVSKVTVVNSSNIGISNKTIQNASSGNAVVQGNTTGGTATSGNATNTNSGNFTITVTY